MTMRLPRRPGACALAALALLAGCAAAPPADAPALIAPGTQDACRGQIEAGIAAALGGRMTLAADAFRTQSELLVDRAQVRDAAGRIADGRRLGVPERFRLALSGARCLLVRDADGSRTPLPACACLSR